MSTRRADDSTVNGKRVLIVGGNSPIAVATAQRFKRSGARVAGVGLEAMELGDYDLFLVGDCSQSDLTEEVVSKAATCFGGLDAVILGSARMSFAAAHEATDEQWETVLGATLNAGFYVARSVLPHLAPDATIVAISSVNANRVSPGLPAYSAAKAGLEGLVRQLALEYGPRGIRVNAVAPGRISADPSDESEGYPLGRVGRPGEVAEAIYFLSNDASSFITGVTLPVDGGLSIGSTAAWLKPSLRERWL